MKKSKINKTVVCQDWLESERGWGTRPDGCSLHLNKLDLEKFVKAYWARMPDETPDEYSRPCGQAYLVDVSDEIYSKILESKNGIRR